VRGTPSASVGCARGPRDASGYAAHGRVTPRHMTTVPSSLPFSLGIKVTTLAKPRPGETVRLSMVGAATCKFGFAAAHAHRAKQTVQRSVILRTVGSREGALRQNPKSI
jgi:hypothetical protein